MRLQKHWRRDQWSRGSSPVAALYERRPTVTDRRYKDCGTDSPASSRLSPVHCHLSPGFTLLELLIAVTITLLIAGLMLTTEAMISEIPEKKEAPAGGHNHGGMDGMY